MSKRSVEQLKSLTDQIVKTNNSGEITAVKDNSLRKNDYDSFLNLIDGGLVIDAETGYSTAITPSSDYAFATKKYVDDATAGIDLSEYIRLDGTSDPTSGLIKIGIGLGFSLADNSAQLLFTPNSLVLNADTRLEFDADGGEYNFYSSTNNKGIFNFEALTANRNIVWQDKAYTGVADLSDIPSLSGYLTNTLLSGKIFVGNGSNVATGVDLTLSGAPGSFDLSDAGVLTMPDAATGTRGLLSSADWNTFNNKQDALPLFNTNEILTADLDGEITSSGYTLEDFVFSDEGEITVKEINILGFGTVTPLSAMYSNAANNLYIGDGFASVGIDAPLTVRNITPDTTSRNLGGTSGGNAWNILYVNTVSSNSTNTGFLIRHLGTGNMTIQTNDYTAAAGTSTTAIVMTTGSITNAGASGNTGSFFWKTGSNAGSGTTGNYYWGVTATQSNLGRNNFFFGDTVLLPTGNPTGGVYFAIDAGIPKYRLTTGDTISLSPQSGWGTPTGTLTRTTFDTTTVTLPQLAERVAALISDLKTQIGLLKA